jgi:hypothetical protein
MTKSPKRVSRKKLRQLCIKNRCEERLADVAPTLIDSKRFTPEETAATGVVEWRFEERSAPGYSCVLQEDIFTHRDGRKAKSIVTLEVDSQVYHPDYSEPLTLENLFKPSEE